MDPCVDCQRGPAGIAGHDRLFSHTMHPTEMHFLCRACGKSWKRQQDSAAAYTWEPIKAPFGMDVPGRPGTAPP